MRMLFFILASHCYILLLDDYIILYMIVNSFVSKQRICLLTGLQRVTLCDLEGFVTQGIILLWGKTELGCIKGNISISSFYFYLNDCKVNAMNSNYAYYMILNNSQYFTTTYVEECISG